MHQPSVYICEHAGMKRAMESKTKSSIGTGQMTSIRLSTERYQRLQERHRVAKREYAPRAILI